MAAYSQGGQLIHNAAKQLPSSTMAAVSSVVIFGDPGKVPRSYACRSSASYSKLT
jgi:hypothetical protein